MADDEIRQLTDDSAPAPPAPAAIGYAHTMSGPNRFPSRLPSRIPRQPRKPSTILLHWTQYWEPQCILASKHTHDPSYTMTVYRESHDRRTAALLAAGIPWTTILRNDLDSPLQSGADFARALQLAIERRRARMGRVKGQSRHAIST